MRIGIIASPIHPQIQQLVDTLQGQDNHEAIVFDPAMNPTDQVTMSATEMTWCGTNLLDLDLFFVQGFSHQDPVIPDDGPRDYSVWRFDYLVTQQKYSFLYSLLSELQRRGKRVINPVGAHFETFMKPMMLERLRQAGCAVPTLLTTNLAEEAKAFMARHNTVVWRPVTGKAQFQLFKEKQRLGLMQPGRPPVMLAEAVAGSIVRGYVFERQPWLLLEYKSPDYEMEESLEYFWDVAHPEVGVDLARIADTLRAPWYQVSFVVKDERAYIYDVDTDPCYVDLPKVYENAIRDRLAAALSGGESTVPATGSISPKGAQPRPTMFLRRMLDVLYEFEQSKYS